MVVATAALALTSVRCGQLLGLDDFHNCPEDPECPSCTDGKKNGDETDVDCGGTCPGKCGAGRACGAAGDCESGVCTDGKCAAPAGPGCDDGEKNGNETGKDCGGGACPGCPVGEGCIVGTDCESLACGGSHVCVAPRCDDMVKNGDETDADCGGSCPPCALEQHCAQDSDCAPHVCSGGTCAMACSPGDKQCSGLDAQTCDASGVWQTTASCPYLCDAGSCTGECTPDGKQCSGLDVQTCDASGVWQTTASCPYLCDAGNCTGCAPGTKQCAGNIPQTCGADKHWQSGASCSGTTPFCSGGTCSMNPPSCQAGTTGAGANCGPSSNESCCTSLLVPGGSFYRSYDGVDFTDMSSPATVSGFKLDKFEVTVGRFRQFVNAWVGGWRPAAGSGKHGHLDGGGGLVDSGNPGSHETGWDTAWEAGLATTASAWNTNLACNGTYATWTPSAGSNEKRPMNCMNFYEAYAFCIWDGGFLPSEAEWNYAASGGSQQRVFPWGATAPGANANLAVYDCNYNSPCTGVTNIAPVGAVAAGNGRWGQADLAGNVFEWALDWWQAYVTPCSDCAYVATGSLRIIRGGAFVGGADYLHNGYRTHVPPTGRGYNMGARCARSP